jgi:tRNA/tmRNA/rRNA uracil-C5-methylase (TrmA/RlmC/RlmD family)
VEIVEEAVRAAEINARKNRLTNCRFLAGDVLKVLDEIEEKPDVIVLDPPRDGVHPKALKKILSYGVESILYISCKPTSLARDLLSFTENGYEVKRISCVDMFPYTPNVETVCLLSNRKPDTKVRIDVDLEDYYRIKDAKKNQN